MDPFNSLAKFLLVAGAVLFAAGGLLLLLGKTPGFGRLPGDIFIQRGNFSFYFPVATGIVLSIILTVLLNLFFLWRR